MKINNAYQSLLIGTTLQLIVNPGGSVARHPVSNVVYVQPAHSCICISLNDIRREIMLFPETGNNYAMVDPFRQNVPLPKVIVPVYPEVGDLLCVTGEDDDEPWRALVTEVNYRTSTVAGFFCVKHPHYDDNGLWVRERTQRKETIHFNSLLSVVDGEWMGSAWREN